MKIYVKSCLFFLLFLSACTYSFSDTINLKNGETIKGVILEDYADRIQILTVDGEKKILKSNIQRVIYDLEEQNLVSRGDSYSDNGLYPEAYYYYEKALKINPEYKKARDGLNFAIYQMNQEDAKVKLDTIRRHNETERPSRILVVAPHQFTEEETAIKNTLGIAIKNSAESFEVSGITPNSPAGKADLKKGDILLAVWGKNVSYMQPKEVISKLLDPTILNIQLTIDRLYSFPLPENAKNYEALLGAELGFSEMEGLVIKRILTAGPAEKAGLKKDDIVTEIQKKSTLHMPLGEVKKLVLRARGKNIFIRIKRDVTLWRTSYQR